LIDVTLRALLNSGDEILVPSPDYPLWSASVALNRGKAVHYPCHPDNHFLPDVDQLAQMITAKTRGIVLINPNNPTGAVYPRDLLEAIARLAEKHRLVVFSDEIYDQMLFDEAQHVPMATLVHETLCVTYSGLSKVYRACGYRMGWAVFSGDCSWAQDYMHAVDLLASLRLCPNVPGQWAVQTALGGYQSIKDLVAPGGRLFESRQAIIDAVAASRFLSLVPPAGAMYAFPKVSSDLLPRFDDHEFALQLLESKHVLVAPGSSFNVPYRDHFRVTTLPDPAVIQDVFARIEDVLEGYQD
jgi:alanine-synthesizing transaminase